MSTGCFPVSFILISTLLVLSSCNPGNRQHGSDTAEEARLSSITDDGRTASTPVTLYRRSDTPVTIVSIRASTAVPFTSPTFTEAILQKEGVIISIAMVFEEAIIFEKIVLELSLSYERSKADQTYTVDTIDTVCPKSKYGFWKCNRKMEMFEIPQFLLPEFSSVEVPPSETAVLRIRLSDEVDDVLAEAECLLTRG